MNDDRIKAIQAVKKLKLHGIHVQIEHERITFHPQSQAQMDEIIRAECDLGIDSAPDTEGFERVWHFNDEKPQPIKISA